MSITIVKERHYNAALNTMGKVSKAQDRLIKHLLKREELIVEQRKMQAHPYTRMKATSSMLRKIKAAEEKVLKAAKSLFEGLAAKGLGQLLKQLDLRRLKYLKATRRANEEVN